MRSHGRLSLLVAGALTAGARAASSGEPTPGYPEAVVQWGVQKGETCEDIAKVLYGSAKHVLLLQRYNRVTCRPGAPLREGMTLVLPEKVTVIPDARMGAMNPDVRARPPGAGWGPAAPGMPLYSSSNVNTLDRGRADIEFVDRTHVNLAPNTLVVIYGTANQTRVGKTPPAAVEVEAGEVKAGLAALRGESVEVALKGGGRVSAASRDTVVQRKGDRTTVAVFDGKAGVTSGGKAVEVPKNFGTRFVGAAPPAPPRPLPPAPAWAPGGTDAIALSPGGQGLLQVAWEAVPAAVAYRVEVGRDAGFDDLVFREEVPADTRAFRAEKVPAGTYHLRVRAIDKEEYLGIASADRVVKLVPTSLDGGGAIKAREIEANPYGTLRFSPSPDLEMAVDDGPFGPMPGSLDLPQRAPKEIRLRPRGGAGAAASFALRYTPVKAAIEARADKGPSSLDVRVSFTGLEGVDVPAKVAPSVRVQALRGARGRAGGGAAPRSQLLSSVGGGVFGAVVPLEGAPEKVRVDVVDARGAVLGTAEVELPRPAPPPALPKPGPRPTLGLTAPLFPMSPVTDMLWFSPTAPNAAAASAGLSRVGDAWAVQGQVRASGSIGRLGLDAALRSDMTGDAPSDASAWFGARIRAPRLGRADFELAPALRVGLPMVASGAPARIELGIAAGGALGRFTLLADIGLRLRLSSALSMVEVPRMQTFLLAGATVEVTPWLRAAALTDVHLIELHGSAAALAGLGASIEAGRTLFGALSLRASPFAASGEGPVSAQLAIGVREFAR